MVPAFKKETVLRGRGKVEMAAAQRDKCSGSGKFYWFGKHMGVP